MQYKLLGYSEIDKAAIRTYCAIHNVDTSLNLGDITQMDIETLPDCDFVCGGSPCQDISIAGAMLGTIHTCVECGYTYEPLTLSVKERNKCPICNSYNIERTRSSLIVNLLDVVRVKQPKIFIFENVKNIVGKRYEKTFSCVISELQTYGYTVQYKVLNARNFGVPQNRERLYLVAIRNDIYKSWEFPVGTSELCSSKDFLETYVPAKYYLNERNIEKFKVGLGFTTLVNAVNMSVDGRILCDKTWNKHKMREYVNCITAREDRGLSARVAEGTAVVERYTDKHTGMQINTIKINDTEELCVRKLTPHECFRCMGFNDMEFARIEDVSDAQLYKQAGNSVVVNVLTAIYESIYRVMPEIFTDMRVLSFFSGVGAFETALDRLNENNLPNMHN